MWILFSLIIVTSVAPAPLSVVTTTLTSTEFTSHAACKAAAESVIQRVDYPAGGVNLLTWCQAK